MLRRQVEQPLADRGELGREVGEGPSCGTGPRADSASPVNTTSRPAQYRLTEPGVWPARADDLELHVGDVEAAAVGHLDLRVARRRVRRAPQQPVGPVQRDRRLVPLGHLDRGGDVGGVPVRADHREDLALADLLEHAGRVLPRVDDDHLFVVTDEPGVPLARLGVSVPSRQRGDHTRSTRASMLAPPPPRRPALATSVPGLRTRDLRCKPGRAPRRR